MIREESSLTKFFNKHSFEELIPVIDSMLEYGKIEDEGVMVTIWTAGWSDDEDIVNSLLDFRSKHRRNYIGKVFACFYFVKDKEDKDNFDFEIVALPKRKDDNG